MQQLSRDVVYEMIFLNDEIKRAGTLKKFKKRSQGGMANHGILQFVNKYLLVLLSNFFFVLIAGLNQGLSLRGHSPNLEYLPFHKHNAFLQGNLLINYCYNYTKVFAEQTKK